MKVLIVHAHPEPDSFCSAMAGRARALLAGQGHEVEFSDLHAMNFNPVAGPEDFAQRKNADYLTYALEQRHAYENGGLAADISAEADKVAACDLILLTFPLYWFAAPAILKGWIDRVFLSGLFYGGKRFYDRGGMRGKKAMIAVTLGGRAHMFGPQAIHGELTTMLSPLLRGALAYVGFEVLEPFFAFHVPYLAAEDRARILTDFEETLATLDTRGSLRFPKMAEFDDRLYPLAPRDVLSDA